MLQLTVAIIVVICYGTMLLTDSIAVVITAFGLANIVFSIMRLELANMLYDRHYFGTSTLVLVSGIMGGVGAVGSVVGCVFAAFLQAYTAVACTFAFTLVQVVVVCSITER